MATSFTRPAAALLLAVAACSSHATLITFDERPWILGPDEYAFYANPIDDEYDSLGVDFDTGYRQPANPNSSFSSSQYLLGANGFSITFTEATLPTFVSLTFGSPFYEFRATVTALGADGRVIGQADSGGDYLDSEGNWMSSPYRPRSLASFHDAAGIARLTFGVETNHRLEAMIDNLYFGQVAPVPEPSAFALGAAGLALVGVAARRQRRVRPKRNGASAKAKPLPHWPPLARRASLTHHHHP